jgi:uncharacterized protein YecT (DUF1311 family)
MPLTLRTLLFACFLFLPLLQASAQDDCAQSGDREQIECLSQKIDAARAQLETVYTAALARMPANDPDDRRKSRVQLTSAQTAWQAFVEANCAYVGGAEGGSNQWVTNFASRCELQAIRERIVFLEKTSGESAPPPVASRSPDAATAQQLLNILGKPAAPSAWIAGLPDSYANWTDAQRATAPRQIQGRCLTLFGMMNDAGMVNLLPPPQALDESSRLAIALCTTAHMPKDWPERSATLAEIQRTLRRSTDLGKPLVLPPGL